MFFEGPTLHIAHAFAFEQDDTSLGSRLDSCLPQDIDTAGMESSGSTTTLVNDLPRRRQGTDMQRDDQREKTPMPVAPSEADRFFWTYTEEPHKTRRQEIIKAHPDVLKLCGPEPLTFPLVVAVVGLQIGCAYALRNTPVLSWSFLLTAYIVGATANQNLFLAIHEISHNLAFKSPIANRLLAIFANVPIGIPYSASFRPYHLTHHKSLGVDGMDTDLPTALEAWFLDSVAGKAFFCTFQILFYALRPMMVYKLPLTWIHALNIAVQVAFDVAIVRYLGGKALGYFILSSFLAGSLHPCAGHFIAEHYVFAQHRQLGKSPASTKSSAAPPPETYSYLPTTLAYTTSIMTFLQYPGLGFGSSTRLLASSTATCRATIAGSE